MKKDRNTFFAENQMYQQTGFGMNPNMPYGPPPMPAVGPMGNPAPYQTPMSGAPSYGVPTNTYPSEYTVSSNIETRLAKMERQIIRLESRLNKLEHVNIENTYSNEENDVNINNSMYIV